MRQIAVERAAEHLELARQAVLELDLSKGYKQYSTSWSQFLSQVSRFYSKLEQGAKGSRVSEPWFGRKKHERKTDPLLSYLHHARDSDEHGIEYITRRMSKASTFEFQAVKDEPIQFRMLYRKTDDGTIEFADPMLTKADKPIPLKLVESVEPRVELLTVKDSRYGDAFAPPLSHLGVEIHEDTSPQSIASVAVRYLEKMLIEASELPPLV